MLLLFGALEANCSTLESLPPVEESITYASLTPLTAADVVGAVGVLASEKDQDKPSDETMYNAPVQTPEPGTFILITLGLIGLAIAGRK